mmetsp:Transcript_16562/g.35893  ORF Transcript_16562/g.35893 Transcript_16562/m.35893 type:complete len:103 (+) Transcript_16562:31-339(+)
MIKHVVIWKLLEEANGKTKAENAREFKARLEALIPKIKAIKSMEVGIGYAPEDGPVADMTLTSIHDSKEGLQEYIDHPDHQEVVAFAKGIVAERRVVDYEIN